MYSSACSWKPRFLSSWRNRGDRSRVFIARTPGPSGRAVTRPPKHADSTTRSARDSSTRHGRLLGSSLCNAGRTLRPRGDPSQDPRGPPSRRDWQGSSYQLYDDARESPSSGSRQSARLGGCVDPFGIFESSCQRLPACQDGDGLWGKPPFATRTSAVSRKSFRKFKTSQPGPSADSASPGPLDRAERGSGPAPDNPHRCRRPAGRQPAGDPADGGMRRATPTARPAS